MFNASFTGNDEGKVIQDAYAYMKDYHTKTYGTMKLGGFNIVQCDIALLMSRFMKYDIPSFKIFKKKYDYMDIKLLLDDDYQAKGKLTDYLDYFGIKGKYNGVDGSKVQQMYLDGKWDEIDAYSKQDAEIEYLLLEKVAQFKDIDIQNTLVFDTEFVVPEENIPQKAQLFKWYCDNMPKNTKVAKSISAYRDKFDMDDTRKLYCDKNIFNKFKNKIISVSVAHQ